MACYRNGGCGPYEMYSCSECPASKPEYAQKTSTCSFWEQVRLIDANALEEVVYDDLHCRAEIENEEFDLVINYLDSAPTIDPESLRPQGEWIDIYGGKYANPRYACSACGEKALYKFEKDDLARTIAVQALSESCPNCGAKMKGKTK